MTPTDIVNQSLGLLGESAISSYDENSPVGRAVRAHYQTTLESLLRRHRWNFARKRAQLTQLATAPAFGFSYAYPLPIDCLRVLELNGLSALVCEADFEIEGQELLTDASTAKIVYVRKVDDPSKWDSLFVEAFVCKLGAALAVQVADSLQKQQVLEARLEQLKLPNAIGVDANESKPRVIHPGTGSESLASRGVSVDAFGASFGGGSSYDGTTAGATGEAGDNGWTPVPSTVTDGNRILISITWAGGEGAQPENGYVSPSGITSIVGSASDFRGGTGLTGSAGTNGTNGTDGNDGWSPVFAIVADSARRVLQVVDWAGGEGTKPAIGLYVGATGLEALIADGVDIRGATGAAGAGTGDVVGPASATANAIALFNGTSGQLIKDSTYTITGAGAALIDDADATAQRATLGLVIGTNVQAYDADLSTWAGVTPGAGVAAFLVTPSSANLLAAITDETGTGANVFATSPTLVTPLLGTPTSGVLTNCTGLPTAGLVDDAVTAAKLADTAVTPGSYTASNITVDQQGRITAAANGTAGISTGKAIAMAMIFGG